MKIDGEPITDPALRKMRGLFASGVTVVTTVHDAQVVAGLFEDVSETDRSRGARAGFRSARNLT